MLGYIIHQRDGAVQRRGVQWAADSIHIIVICCVFVLFKCLVFIIFLAKTAEGGLASRLLCMCVLKWGGSRGKLGDFFV